MTDAEPTAAEPEEASRLRTQLWALADLVTPMAIVEFRAARQA